MPKSSPARKTPSPRTRLEDARERMYRELILESAEVVFGDKGFAGATMQDIAGRAGISLKTLYANFDSKQALIEEVEIMRGKAFVEACNEAIFSGTTPMEAIAKGIHAYVAYLFEHRAWMKLHLRTRASWALRPTGKEALAMWRAGHSAYSDALEQGVEQKLFAPGDPEELAALTQAIMQVSVARAADQGNFDTAAVAERILVHVRHLLGASD